jgi:hypothetical protein
MTAKEKPESEMLPHEKKCAELLSYLGSQRLAAVLVIYDLKANVQYSCQNFPGTDDALAMLESESKHIREKESH